MTFEQDDEVAYLELVADRCDFLATLTGDSLDKRELTDTLPYSRSTVDRVIRDLSAAGLVLDTDGGYTASLKGRYLTTLFDSYRRDIADILEMDAAIGTETGEFPLPVEALLGATQVTSTAHAPHRPHQFLTERFDHADYATAVMPRLPNDMLSERFVEWVSAGHACRLILSESTVTNVWREFPELIECVQSAPEFDIRVGSVPPYGLVYTVADGIGHSMAILYDKGRIQSVIANSTDDAVDWVRTYTQSLWREASSFDLGGHLDTLLEDDSPDQTGAEPATTSDGSNTHGLSSATHLSLPTKLQSQGFVRLSSAYFERVGVSPPLACWRTGFDLGEVRVGYALDRERPTETGRENVTTELFSSLRNATDHVVLGPPGAGKSTVCMSVACRWHDQRLGPVLYRKSGHRDAFSATPHLGSYLAEAPGHTLVVVEDVTRAEANDVFELVREFADDDQVTFLFDSRKNEWQSNRLVGAARLESHRTQTIETYDVPLVDATERERIVDHFEETVDSPVDIDPDDLSVGDDEFAPGEMYLFVHRLARHIEPSSTDDVGPTSLLEDIDDVYEDLQAVGDLAIDVGVLVNLLNAAGVGVDIPLAYVLASTRADEAIVEDALNELERSVLYSAFGDNEAESVRTVHETWSARFLQRLLEIESERQARRRFEDCLEALFSLVDDHTARTSVQSVFGGTADIVRTIEDDPSGWGDNLVKNVFQLGVNNPSLSALYAETDYSRAVVPAACDSSLALNVRRWRARMFVNGGELDRAKREFESLASLTADDADSHELTDEELTRAHADGLAGVSEVLRHRGAYDESKDAAEAALELFEELDDDLGRSDVLNTLGTIEGRRGAYEHAIDYLEAALALRRDVGHQSKIASTLSNLAGAEQLLGRYDDAKEHAHQSLEIRRELGYQWGESLSLSILGIIELRTHNFDEAEQYTRSALSIRRQIGDSMGIASSLNNLGSLEFDRGRISDAHARYTALVDWLEEENLEFGWIRGSAHHGLAKTLLEQGEAKAALDQVQLALDVIEDRNEQVELQSIRAIATLRSGSADEARAIAKDAYEQSQELDEEQQVRASLALGQTLVAVGEETRGIEHLESAVELASDDLLKGYALSTLGDVYHSLGRLADAVDSMDDAAARFSAVNARGHVERTVEHALDIADELEDDDRIESLTKQTNQ
ncbi:tetratricopeptide repeat protein [Haloferax namakaokahaiae]|uniref:Tetratricopeptide repeat protein n=1 Tax=Haloferax namakaokahaiae TaxID=1748331 RepID=A0ABD5ZCT7_9EURY